MYRLIALFYFLSIQSLQAQDEWDLRLLIGGKGDRNILTSKCYSRSELINEIPFTDIEPNFRRAADQTDSLSSEVISLGDIGDTEFIEIQQRINGIYYDYIRILSIENEMAQLCPFYAIIANDGNIARTTSYLINDSMLVNKSRVSGSGGLWVENYFYLENGIVYEFDVDTVLNGDINGF